MTANTPWYTEIGFTVGQNCHLFRPLIGNRDPKKILNIIFLNLKTTTSVCNTLKRAVLIWFSVVIFKNQVDLFSALGSILVISGVLLYIQAKNIDKATSPSSNGNLHKI